MAEHRLRKRTVITFVVAVGLATLLHYIGWLRPFETLGAKLVNPMIQFAYRQNIHLDKLGLFKEKQELISRIEELESLVSQMQHLEATSQQLLVENNELKQQLNFFRAADQYRWVTCNVVGKSIEERTSGLIIDCGTRGGVAAGQAVVAGEGVLVGKVVDAKENTAIVRLLNDSKSRIMASALNRDKSIGLVQGGFGISIQLTHVPQGEVLEKGDVIVSSGLESLPRGLVIGEVEAVVKESYQPFQRAVLKTPLDYQKALLLSVIVN